LVWTQANGQIGYGQLGVIGFVKLGIVPKALTNSAPALAYLGNTKDGTVYLAWKGVTTSNSAVRRHLGGHSRLREPGDRHRGDAGIADDVVVDDGSRGLIDDDFDCSGVRDRQTADVVSSRAASDEGLPSSPKASPCDVWPQSQLLRHVQQFFVGDFSAAQFIQGSCAGMPVGPSSDQPG
jgi:hypothetical protein